MYARRRKTYVGDMSTQIAHPALGSTAVSAVPGPRASGVPPGRPAPPAAGHPRHLVGSALRAVGVYLDSAFRVAVLGIEGTRQPEP